MSLSNNNSSPNHSQQQFRVSCFCGMIGNASLSGCCVDFGSLLAISTNRALTLFALFAEVSMCRIPLSSAYWLASSKSTLRRASRSALFPALTLHDTKIRLGSKTDYLAVRTQIGTHHCNHNIRIPPSLQLLHPRLGPGKRIGVSDIIDNNGCSGPPVIPGCERAISFLAGRVPVFCDARR